MLSTIIMLPFLAAVLISFMDSSYFHFIRVVALIVTLLVFLLSIQLVIIFDNNYVGFQFLEYFDLNGLLGLQFQLGVDGLSLNLILLTAFTTSVCVMVSWSSIKVYTKEFIVFFLLLESSLMAVFSLLDLFLFYVTFEFTLLPMFYVVGIWGSRSRRINAAYFLFLYTLFGSVFMLVAILYIWVQCGTTNFQVLSTLRFSEFEQIVLWLAFFLSFAVKLPMVPFHIWLPEAHVEAPTPGSMILAGVLLKLGGYGFLRFSLTLFPEATAFFAPLVLTLSIVGVIYASFTTLQQVDLKKIIAYSSVAHMGFVTLGIFSLNVFGIEGSVLLMVSHGIVSAGLFLCVGILYDRFHTRLVKSFSGLVQLMPVFSLYFLVFSLANLGLPLTSNFVGEILVLAGVFQTSSMVGLLASTSMVLGAAYTLWLVNRVCFGNLKTLFAASDLDLNRREFFMLLPFFLIVFTLGIFPSILLDNLHAFSVLLL